MQNPLEKQHAINVASGYNFMAYATTTLMWLVLVFGSGFAILFATMAAIASLLGLLCCAKTMRGKFLWIPLISLAYLTLGLTYVVAVPQTHPGSSHFQISLCGVFYSAALLPVLISIARHDFAKAVPVWICRSCGYTLLGLKHNTCPECGRTLDLDRIPDIAANQHE